jgi:chromosome segregation ATPase
MVLRAIASRVVNNPELIEIRNLLDGLRIGQDRLTQELTSFRAEVLDRFDQLERRVERLEIQVRQLQHAVLENRKAIEENRRAIEENRKAIEGNRKAIEGNRKAIEENRNTIESMQVELRDVRQTLNRARMDRRVDDQRIERLELRVSLLEQRLGLTE